MTSFTIVTNMSSFINLNALVTKTCWATHMLCLAHSKDVYSTSSMFKSKGSTTQHGRIWSCISHWLKPLESKNKSYIKIVFDFNLFFYVLFLVPLMFLTTFSSSFLLWTLILDLTPLCCIHNLLDCKLNELCYLGLVFATYN